MADYSAQYEHVRSVTLNRKKDKLSNSKYKRKLKSQAYLAGLASRRELHHRERMASNQQYQFPPPPPPPPTGHPPQNYGQPNPQYGYPQHQGPPRGGGARGGRGGGPHAPAPYPHQAGYNGPPQGPPAGYNPQNPGPYLGPQVPGPQGGPPVPQPGYPGPQWQGEPHPQHGPPHNGPPQHGPMQPPPQATPLSAQNYHPNYAPQAYQQQQQQQPPPLYGPQQPPQQFQQHPPSYGHSVPPQQPPQWSGPPQHGPPQFRGRGRGGFTGARGGHDASAPLMGPPIRMGFDNQERDHMAQAGNGFPPQYSNQSPPAQFSPPSYQGYPPQGFPQRGPLDQYSGPPRGRGGMGFRGRGRGDFQMRGRDARHNGSRHSSEAYQKPTGVGPDGKKKKRRRTNTLGLTPNGVDHESSEEEDEDVDEEARLVTLLGPDTPSLPSNLDTWLAERKARFPTKARRDAAEEELRKRREQAQDGKSKDHHEKSIKKEEGESKLERQQRKAEKLRAELEKAERKIQDSMSGGKRKRENGDEGDDDRGQVSDEDSDSSSSGSDTKPEVMTSRSTAPVQAPPPQKAQLQRHCKYFSTGGTCGKKGKCRFVHDQEVRNQALKDKEANGGKMTLAQRLILNDTAKDDLTILKSIKYLKEKGLMSDPSANAPKSENGPEEAIKTEENGLPGLGNY